MNVVVDTNVAVAANGGASHIEPLCQLKCVERLEMIVTRGRVFIDDANIILGEYADYLSFAGQPGVGDRFFRHLFQNQANPNVCRRVSITMRGADGDFEEFPRDPRLARFDRADRKFVAVAVVSGHHPRIQNATDSDWRNFEAALLNHGVVVDELCQ